MIAQERRRIFALINEGVNQGFNLKEMVKHGLLSLEDARWYVNHMTEERIDDVRRTNAELNKFIDDGKLEDIDYKKLFEGFDEFIPWKDEGF